MNICDTCGGIIGPWLEYQVDDPEARACACEEATDMSLRSSSPGSLVRVQAVRRGQLLQRAFNVLVGRLAARAMRGV